MQEVGTVTIGVESNLKSRHYKHAAFHALFIFFPQRICHYVFFLYNLKQLPHIITASL